MIKIACHGCFGCSINADARDSNSNQDRTLAISKTKELIQKVFPAAIDIESGPEIEETCIYTMTPDGDFILDSHPQLQNLTIATGFSGHGFKMGPEVGEVLADLATKQTPQYNMVPFKISRFFQKDC